MDVISALLRAFLTGGLLCLIGQALIDKTALTPALILTSYVVAGVALGALGVYQPLCDWAGAGAAVPLTFKEFELLRLLLEAKGAVLTREVLMDRVWDLTAERENRTLDVHIRTLRAKLGDAGYLIETVRGVGYRVTTQPSAS